MISSQMRIPEISESVLFECREAGSFLDPLFELYKSAGIVCFLTAEEVIRSARLEKLMCVTLAGLMNRSARLMLANIHLTHENQFGDAAAVLDRCIMETCVNVEWICRTDSGNRLTVFLADGLRSDMKLLELIHQHIKSNGGDVKQIEDRMLGSIRGCIRQAGLTEEGVAEASRLPSYDSRVKDIGLPQDFYISFQRMGSHAVHGSWTNLLHFYLREPPDGHLVLRDSDIRPAPDQYAMFALAVIRATATVAKFALGPATAKDAVDTCARIHDGVMTVYRELFEPDSAIVRTEPQG